MATLETGERALQYTKITKATKTENTHNAGALRSALQLTRMSALIIAAGMSLGETRRSGCRLFNTPWEMCEPLH